MDNDACYARICAQQRVFVPITLFQHSAYLFIIVECNDIRNRMFPAVVHDDRPHLVECLGQMIDGFRKLLAVGGDVSYPQDSLNGTHAMIEG